MLSYRQYVTLDYTSFAVDWFQGDRSVWKRGAKGQVFTKGRASFLCSLICLFVCLFVCLSVHSSVHLSIHKFVPSFIHSLDCSFVVHLFIHPYLYDQSVSSVPVVSTWLPSASQSLQVALMLW